MKNKTSVIVLLFIATFVVGCKQEQTASQQLDKLKSETKEVAKNIKDYTYAQKAEFTKSMRTQVNSLEKDLDALSTKIEGSSDAVKAEAKPKLQALREQAAVLNKQLDTANDANESTWDSVKAGSSKAYDDLANGFQQARVWVSEKIAP
jgi:phage host-nuclease inhibitor protein Gam